MAKTRTEISKYTSPSTGEYCSAAQYVAELICQRQADREKLGTLPYKFWNKSKWKTKYIRQVASANKLINEFGEGPVISFIKSKAGNRVISLNPKFVKEQISIFASHYKEPVYGEVIEINSAAQYKTKPSFQSKKTLAQTIKEIENGEKK